MTSSWGALYISTATTPAEAIGYHKRVIEDEFSDRMSQSFLNIDLNTSYAEQPKIVITIKSNVSYPHNKISIPPE